MTICDPFHILKKPRYRLLNYKIFCVISKDKAPSVEEMQNKAYVYRVEQIKFANVFAEGNQLE